MAGNTKKGTPSLENVSLGSGLAENAKKEKIERKNKNQAALEAAMQIMEVNQDKKYNNQYGKGGKSQ